MFATKCINLLFIFPNCDSRRLSSVIICVLHHDIQGESRESEVESTCRYDNLMFFAIVVPTQIQYGAPKRGSMWLFVLLFITGRNIYLKYWGNL